MTTGISARGAVHPWLIVPVQVTIRELLGKTLLAAVAAERGFGVLLGSHRSLRPSIPHLPPGVLWDYSITPPFRRLYETYRRAGHGITATEEEGLGNRLSDAVFDVDRYLAWGPDEADRIEAAQPGARANITPTGHPRFDLLRPELRALYDDAVESTRSRLGRYLLVNTNFGANSFMTDKVFVEAWARSQGDDPPPVSWLEPRVEHSRRLLERFVPMVRELAAAFPDRHVVVRPHPSEREDFWRDAVSGIGNASVERTGPVVPWLAGADAVVHNSCTTGLEAHLLGAPVYSFEPFPGHEYEWQLPNELSVRTSSVDELVDVLRRDLADPRSRPVDGAVVDRYITGTTGELASDRIVDVAAQLARPPCRLPAHVATGVAPVARREWITVKHLGRRALRRTTLPLSLERRKGAGIDVDVVSSTIDALRRATGRFSSVGVARLWRGTVAVLPAPS